MPFKLCYTMDLFLDFQNVFKKTKCKKQETYELLFPKYSYSVITFGILGWIFTLEQYFEKQAKDIITNIVEALNKNQERKFIFAEMSYLSMWWDQASQKLKDMAKS